MVALLILHYVGISPLFPNNDLKTSGATMEYLLLPGAKLSRIYWGCSGCRLPNYVFISGESV